MKNLKPVPADKKKSLGKLPTDVRNKMGYAKKGSMMKAKGGKMMTYKEFVKQKMNAQVSDKELGNLKTDYITKLAGAAISDAEMERLKKTIPGKAKGGEMKKPMKAVIGALALGVAGAKAAKKLMKKKEASAISPAMNYLGDTAKKSIGGEMKQGYGAARTSGMGLQDEDLIPGKSMDYYKDLM